MPRETRERSFDELAKGLVTGTVSRRKALRMFGAGLVGGTLASIPGIAWAVKPVCASGVKCKGECCPEGATCVKGAGGGCTCPTGQTACNGTCVDTKTDKRNCGACGNHPAALKAHALALPKRTHHKVTSVYAPGAATAAVHL